jgi:predicted dinucleotide-binding enzyme
MKIGIIGAGQIGGTLTRRLTQLGHEVSVANSRGPSSLAELARETGAEAVTVREAAKAGQIVIVAIPEGKIPELPKNLFEGVPSDVVVIDTGNYYPRERDGRIDQIEAGVTESRWVANQLRRPVVKAFNTMNYRKLLELGHPRGPGRLALPVAGDDPNAKQLVEQLVNELGFDEVDDGGLDDSWRQQPGTPVYDRVLDSSEVRHALAEAQKGRLPQWRAAANSPGRFAQPA